MSDDITDELSGIQLGDKRRNDRSCAMIKALAAQPQASINAAFKGWSETIAAYRFLDNAKVTPGKILAPHRDATCRRIAEYPVVLIPQDTTELDLTKHPPTDAKCLNKPERFGTYYHVQLAVTPDKLPLGIIGTESFSREPETLGKSRERASLPIEEKESLRWLTGYREACRVAQQCPNTQIVSIGDREADIFDILLDAQQRLPVEQQPPAPPSKKTSKKSSTRPSSRQSPQTTESNRQSLDAQPLDAQTTASSSRSPDTAEMPSCRSSDTAAPTPRRADYIIRSRVDRCTLEPDPSAGDAAYRKVRAEVAASPLRGTYSADLPATPKRAARKATLEVRAATVTIKPPHARSQLAPVVTNVVLVEEIGSPDDDTRVSWLLLTTLPIDTLENVLKVVSYYAARWAIEIFFRTLKSGCRVEELQLETMARFENALAFYTIIAWRVVFLTYLNRECPELPCTAVFEDAEWKSTWTITRKEPLPSTPPSLGEFMKLVAELGGHNNRAKDSAPGPQCIWQGLRRVMDYATAWLTFGPETTRSSV